MALSGTFIPWSNRTAAMYVAVMLCGVPATQAQSEPAARAKVPAVNQPPAFDVASVRPVAGDIITTKPKRSGGRITWTSDLSYFISYAWNLQLPFISGAVPHASTFRLDATTDPAASDDQIRLMFQSLLKDRFKMVAHRITKEVDGYALTVGRNGPKIKEAKAGDPPPPLPDWARTESVTEWEGNISATLPEAGVVVITGRRVSVLKLVETLRRVLGGKTVWDQTGATGDYYFAFRYAEDDNPEADAPSLAAALREHLGLELKKQKGPVEMLVVDSMEKEPTEN
jgi:uncharacterized protein (TIGR03435 family)